MNYPETIMYKRIKRLPNIEEIAAAAPDQAPLIYDSPIRLTLQWFVSPVPVKGAESLLLPARVGEERRPEMHYKVPTYLCSECQEILFVPRGTDPHQSLKHRCMGVTGPWVAHLHEWSLRG